MKRVLFFLISAFLIFGCNRIVQENAGQRRPNILLVVSDDQSWLHTGIAGDPVVKTPAFDRIASEGVWFTQAFCASPSCTASRSAILSGQEIWRTGEAGVLMGSIPPDLKLFPQILETHGYFTGYTGKGWAPGNPGFLGFTGDPVGKAFNSREEKEIVYGIDKRNYTANFRDFLDARPEKTPFFFWFGPTEPHREYQYGAGMKEAGLDPEKVVVPAYWPDHKVVRQDILDYYYEIMWFDTHLAGMVEMLEKTGELDNTLIIVTSDNGMPFPRAKVNLYDRGTRMPLAVRWPERVNPGRRIDDLVSLTDLAPTILETAGIPVPAEMTGKSLMPLLSSDRQGVISPERSQVFTALERHTWCRPEGETYPMRAIRTHDYLYIKNFEPDRWPTGGPDFLSSNKTTHGDVDACPTKSLILKNQQEWPRLYELNFGKRPAEELYNVKNDPDQVFNLAEDPLFSSVRDSMKNLLEQYLAVTGDPRIQGRDPWKDYVYHQENGFGSTYNKALPLSQRERARLRPSDHPDIILPED